MLAFERGDDRSGASSRGEKHHGAAVGNRFMMFFGTEHGRRPWLAPRDGTRMDEVMLAYLHGASYRCRRV